MRPLYLLFIPIVLAYAAGMVMLHEYRADDSLIACRYAENLVDHGQPVYNLGEPVSSMTSPLHVFIEASLYKLTGHTFFAWQMTACACLLVSVVLILRRFRRSVESQLVAASILLISPCVILWSFGGLETLLLLLWITLLCLLVCTEKPMTLTRLVAVLLLAGVCFVTRYDSVLFTAPVVIHATWRNRRPWHIAATALVGAILPMSWLIFAKIYYGDIFPTSYYVKSPTFHIHAPLQALAALWKNGSYMTQCFTLTGVVPLVVLWFAAAKGRSTRSIMWQVLLSGWGVSLAIAAMLTYGLSVATTHMMFSFRYLVPYLPAVVIVLATLYSRVPSPAQAWGKTASRWFVALIILIAGLQAWQSWYTLRYSVNGAVVPPANYEWTYLSAKDQEVGLKLYELQADDIRRHWNGLANRPDRPPRIHTFVGGTTPYYYRDAYVFETLASYRHHFGGDMRPYADYIQSGATTGAKNPPQLPGPESDYVLISRRPNTTVSGRIIDRNVYYNPHPLDNPLPSRIDGLPPAK